MSICTISLDTLGADFVWKNANIYLQHIERHGSIRYVVDNVSADALTPHQNKQQLPLYSPASRVFSAQHFKITQQTLTSTIYASDGQICQLSFSQYALQRIAW